MKNLFDNWRHRGAAISGEDEAALSSDLDAAYAVPVPSNLNWDAALAAPQRSAATAPVRVDRRHGRTLGFGVAVAAAVVAAVAITLPIGGGGGTQTVSAQEIIDRSIAAASGQGAGLSYHIVEEWTYPDGEWRRAETWRDGTGKQRHIFRGGPQEFGIIDNGTTLWQYAAWQSGVTTASSRPSPTDPDDPGMLVEPQRPGSLADAAADLSISGCFAPTLSGESTISGRIAYVVKIESTGLPCDDDWLATEQARTEMKIFDRIRTVWIDEESYYVLRTEDLDRTTGETTIMEVKVFELNVEHDPGTFEYVAPVGVTVVEVSDNSSMKDATSDLSPGQVEEPGTLTTVSGSWAYTLSSVSEATSMSDVVAHVRILPGVVVHSDEDDALPNQQPRRFELRAEVIDSSKGPTVAGEILLIRQMSGAYGGAAISSSMEIPLEVGKEYLLFLGESRDGSFRTDALRTFNVDNGIVVAPGEGWEWRKNLGLVGLTAEEALAEARRHAKKPRPSWWAPAEVLVPATATP